MPRSTPSLKNPNLLRLRIPTYSGWGKTQYRTEAAITSLVHIDEKNGFLLVHDSGAERLTVLDRDLDFHDRHPAPGVYLVQALARENELYLLNIGDLFCFRNRPVIWRGALCPAPGGGLRRIENSPGRSA